MKKSNVLATIIGGIIGAAAGAGVVGKYAIEQSEKQQQMSDKHLALFQLMTQWVKVKQEGKNLSEYFEANGLKKIAVYGMSFAGETLVEELKGTKTEVLYGIDQRADNIYAEINVVTMDEELEKVDAIVVTAITFFDEIKEKLNDKTECQIISLEDVVYEV